MTCLLDADMLHVHACRKKTLKDAAGKVVDLKPHICTMTRKGYMNRLPHDQAPTLC